MHIHFNDLCFSAGPTNYHYYMPLSLYELNSMTREQLEALAKEYNIPRSTVKNWFAKTNNGIDVLIDRRPQYSGRIANLDTDYKQRYEILKKMEDFLMLQQGRKPSL